MPGIFGIEAELNRIEKEQKTMSSQKALIVENIRGQCYGCRICCSRLINPHKMTTFVQEPATVDQSVLVQKLDK